jgi:hypothetical protein
MERQALTGEGRAGEVPEMVERMCGIQAQVFSYAELALWVRIDGLRAGVLEDALWHERTLLKTWAMRGTLHVVSRRDFSDWICALRTQERYGPIAVGRFDELAELVGGVLDGGSFTRDQLAAEILRRTGSEETAELVRGSWGLHLKPAAMRGRLCFAPSRDREVTFTSPRRWANVNEGERPPSQALRDAARKFLQVYAPASASDFSRWWGGSLTLARKALSDLGDDAIQVDVDGQRQWMLAADLPDLVAAEAQRDVRLLPGFDQWTIAAPRDNDAALDRRCASCVYRAQGWISPVVLVDGRIEGTWRHARRGRNVRVDVTPFRRLTRCVREGVTEQAQRLAAFVERPLELRWSG